MTNHKLKTPATKTIQILSAIFGVIPFVLSKLLFATKNVNENPIFDVVTGLISILFVVIYAQLMIRKRDGIGEFKSLFLGGWGAAFFLGLLVVLFYAIYFKMNPNLDVPKNYILIVLMKYNAMAMIFSSILALIFKTK
jgi:hypothetical protein